VYCTSFQVIVWCFFCSGESALTSLTLEDQGSEKEEEQGSEEEEEEQGSEEEEGEERLQELPSHACR